MGLSCTKVQGPIIESAEGPRKKHGRLSFWKKLRKTRKEQSGTANVAEASQDLPNAPEEIVVQVNCQPDRASSGMELRDDGDELRRRIVRSRLGRRGTQSVKDGELQRVKCIADKRKSRSENDLGRPAEKQRRRPMRQFNRRRPVPMRTKSDTELVKPTRSD